MLDQYQYQKLDQTWLKAGFFDGQRKMLKLLIDGQIIRVVHLNLNSV